MNLTDGQVAALAEQAAELLPVHPAVRITPDPAHDPYRWGVAAWIVHFDLDGESEGGSLHVGVDGRETAAAALATMLGQLSEYASETGALWGRPVPACPGHPHPALVEAGDDDVLLRCPQTGEVVDRIEPAV